MRRLGCLAATLLVWACSSTTENPSGSGGASGAAGASAGGAPGGGGAKSFADCRVECDGTVGAGQAFKAALTTCTCLTATSCAGDCETFCTGLPPTLACVACNDPAKTGCMTNNCSGDCEKYRECLAVCASKL